MVVARVGSNSGMGSLTLGEGIVNSNSGSLGGLGWN